MIVQIDSLMSEMRLQSSLTFFVLNIFVDFLLWSRAQFSLRIDYALLEVLKNSLERTRVRLLYFGGPHVRIVRGLLARPAPVWGVPYFLKTPIGKSPIGRFWIYQLGPRQLVAQPIWSNLAPWVVNYIEFNRSFWGYSFESTIQIWKSCSFFPAIQTFPPQIHR